MDTRTPTHLNTWCNEQGSGQVRAMSDSGQEDIWPPHSVWYLVATVFRSWTPVEGWEDVDGSPSSMGRALQVLTEQLLKKVRSTDGCVGWMFLTALHPSTEKALTEAAQVWDLQSQGDALEARVN